MQFLSYNNFIFRYKKSKDFEGCENATFFAPNGSTASSDRWDLVQPPNV